MSTGVYKAGPQPVLRCCGEGRPEIQQKAGRLHQASSEPVPEPHRQRIRGKKTSLTQHGGGRRPWRRVIRWLGRKLSILNLRVAFRNIHERPFREVESLKQKCGQGHRNLGEQEFSVLYTNHPNKNRPLQNRHSCLLWNKVWLSWRFVDMLQQLHRTSGGVTEDAFVSPCPGVPSLPGLVHSEHSWLQWWITPTAGLKGVCSPTSPCKSMWRWLLREEYAALRFSSHYASFPFVLQIPVKLPHRESDALP